ncbi:MAG: hypothetical protein ACE5OZ_04775 [Candidatus Heimdallarchaeota archaeon]
MLRWVNQKKCGDFMSSLVDVVTENASGILLLAITLTFGTNLWLALDNNMLYTDWDEEIQGEKPKAQSSILLADTLTALALWLAGLCFASLIFNERYDVWLRIASVAAVIVLLVGSPIIG